MNKKQKRADILYARIKKSNKEFVKRKAFYLGFSISEYMDLLIDKVRDKDVSN